MNQSDFAKFYDPINKLTCHFVPVNAATSHLVEPVRDMFINSMNNFGYVGFSREIDEVFHNRSTYIYVTESANVIMTGRITPRTHGTIVPFEMGLRDDGGSYKLNEEESVVDINTYTYVRGYYQKAMPMIAAGFGYYVKQCNTDKAYCLYDIENTKIKQAYLSIGFVLSERFPEPIYFPTFCRQVEDSLTPVRWRVMEWNHETIESQARAAMEQYEFIESSS